ncbi:hypothetical protein TCAL_12896 [Tigriopus californicus]|uniref:C-type lectin domain-containing protein n=1 Tax=Tigriopus californicus TaxID=6832 RepID=A0A553NTQ2_TIGCA|nr:uncharacterized protein LOC131881365 [Tigriopus californicus]TRY68819.1 hypothetical protein TCAL_12896 [Tigriopus californicus]|eukprot:TCALIF_12896-PA protein Name:"Protein of unknown function" AED:0.00 eAED:0.00 QI:84/1/1/1/1/1/2/36/127
MVRNMFSLGVFMLAITSALSSSCCPSIVLQSSGDLASSNQAHILGNYNLVSDDAEGRPIYQLDSSLPRFIFYRSGINNWFVNDQTGINQGYALNTGTEECISDSTGVWEYWDGNAWVQDLYTSAICV